MTWATGPRPDDLELPQHAGEIRRLRRLLPELAQELEQLRGRRFLRPVRLVAWGARHRERFRALLAAHRPSRVRVKRSLVLTALGVRKQPYAPTPHLDELRAQTQVAFFDPERNEIVLCSKAFAFTGSATHPIVLAGRESIVQHELTHALQEQHRTRAPATDPRRRALERIVHEGEASYLAAFRSQRVLNRFISPEHRLRPQDWFDPERSELWYVRDQMRKLEAIKVALPQERQETLEATTAALSQIELWDSYAATDPYSWGPRLIQALHQQGGWKAVDAVLDRPPDTTAQILHPELLLRRAPAPRWRLADASARLGPSWRLESQTVVGERGLRVLFERLTGRPEAAACQGWNGDHAQLYVGPRGAHALRWTLNWTRASDRDAFLLAFQAIKRLPPTLRGYQVHQSGKHLTIVAGSDPLLAVRLFRGACGGRP